MVTFFIANLLSLLIRLGPLGTLSLLRVSGLVTLVVVLITTVALGAVKCSVTVLRTEIEHANGKATGRARLP